MSKDGDDRLSKLVEAARPKPKKKGEEPAFQVTLLSDNDSLCVVDQWVPTGCFPLDMIFGGGYPVGRLTEIYGDTSTGKTLLSTQAVIETQAMGGVAVYADTETALDRDLMEATGVDNSRLIYAAPDTIGQVFEYLDEVITHKNKIYGDDHLMTFVWDSVAASATKEELEGEWEGGRKYPTGALNISASMRRIMRLAARSNVCLIFINQTRQKLGVMFGEDESTYGGKAIPFYSSVRVRLKTVRKLKASGEIVGIDVRIETAKNKLAAPFQQVEVPIYFGEGTFEPGAMLNFMLDRGYITSPPKSAWKEIDWLTEKPIKWQKASVWYNIFDRHYDAILDYIEEEEYDE